MEAESKCRGLEVNQNGPETGERQHPGPRQAASGSKQRTPTSMDRVAATANEMEVQARRDAGVGTGQS